MNKAALSAIVLLCLSLLSFLIRYVLNVFLANHLPVHFYGDVNIAFRTLAIFSSIALLGTTSSSKKFLAHYIRTNDSLSTRSYVKWNFRLIAYTFSICSLLAIASAIILVVFHYLGISPISNYHVAVFMLWVTPISSLVLLFASYLACYEHTILAYTLRTIGKYALLFILFFTSVTFFQIKINSFNVLVILFFTFLILTFFEAIWLFRKMPFIFSSEILSKELSESTNRKEWLQVSTKLIINNLTFQIVCVLDLIIIEVFAATERDVGYYSAILAIIGIIWIIPQGIFQFLKPQICHSLECEEGRIKLQKQFDSVNVILFLVSSLIVSLLIFFSNSLLLHFGPEFLHARTALIITIVASYIGAFTQPSMLLLMYSGHEQLLIKLNFFEITTLLISGIYLTIEHGIVGMAIAYSLSLITKTILTTYFAKEKTLLKPLVVI